MWVCGEKSGFFEAVATLKWFQSVRVFDVHMRYVRFWPLSIHRRGSNWDGNRRRASSQAQRCRFFELFLRSWHTTRSRTVADGWSSRERLETVDGVWKIRFAEYVSFLSGFVVELVVRPTLSLVTCVINSGGILEILCLSIISGCERSATKLLER